MKAVTLSHRGPLKFGFTVFTENGYSGSARGITNVPGMTAIRSVLWTADNETVLFICDTDKENRTGYVFYSITEEAVLRYTTSAHDYVIDENGEISIPE